MSFLGDVTGVGEAVGKASGLITDIIDKIWPNPTEENKAKIEALKANTDAIITEIKAINSAAEAEAKSADPWTSRARPSFLYVMYVMMLFAIPMGFIAAFSPATADAVGKGMGAWLASIPQPMWETFGLFFVVYSGGRTLEKIRGVTK